MNDPHVELQAPEDYRASRQHIFPSPESFRWFLRQNRQELVEAGALVCPTRRWLVQPDACDRVVMQIGQRRAQKSTVRDEPAAPNS